MPYVNYGFSILIVCIYMYKRVILTYFITHHEQVEWIKLSRKVIYHFAVYAIVNEILITKNCQILVLNNFLLKYYQLYRKAARDKNHLFSYKILRIFQNFLVPYFLMLIKIRKCSTKKLIKNSEKIFRVLWEENKWFFSCSFFIKLIVFE